MGISKRWCWTEERAEENEQDAFVKHDYDTLIIISLLVVSIG